MIEPTSVPAELATEIALTSPSLLMQIGQIPGRSNFAGAAVAERGLAEPQHI